MDEAVYQRARAAIDAAHDGDPERVDGVAAERRYADQLERWVAALVDAPTPELRLAARAQHLERWSIPRDSYPMDRKGYHRWRKAVHARQGERAAEILRDAGVAADEAARIGDWIAKTSQDDEAQALEDAACLVFLQEHCAAFAQDRDDEQMLRIIKRTWSKMSERGHELAGTIALDDRCADLVARALAD